MEPLNEYPTSELEALFTAIETQMIASPEAAFKLQVWYERVKEALNMSYSENYEAEYNDMERLNDFDYE